MIDHETAVSRSYLIPGQTWPVELGWFYDTFKESRRHAEVGVFCGRSLHASCAGMGRATVYAVEQESISVGCETPSTEWTTRVLQATINSLRMTSPEVNIIFCQTGSLQVARSLRDKEPLDSVLIDARHEYAETLADIQEWVPRLRVGGIITGHDYCSRFPGVMDAVNELFGRAFSVVPNTRIWYAKKEDLR